MRRKTPTAGLDHRLFLFFHLFLPRPCVHSCCLQIQSLIIVMISKDKAEIYPQLSFVTHGYNRVHCASIFRFLCVLEPDRGMGVLLKSLHSPMEDTRLPPLQRNCSLVLYVRTCLLLQSPLLTCVIGISYWPLGKWILRRAERVPSWYSHGFVAATVHAYANADVHRNKMIQTWISALWTVWSEDFLFIFTIRTYTSACASLLFIEMWLQCA